MVGVRERAFGVAVGVLLDAALGDPRRGHPVAAFGRVAQEVERRLWADSHRRGLVHVVVLVGGVVGLGLAAERCTASRPLGRALLTAAATWAVLGGRSLAAEGSAMSAELAVGDVTAARRRLPNLCGRDPDMLDADGLARAACESVAENTADAVVGPLVWGAVAGVPGLLGYRAVNTLDAMVGHRSERYARFGWAAARSDDVVNVVPSRCAAVVTAVCAPAVGGRPVAAWRAWRRDAPGHPSPNAGPVEAAFAGALGRRLGGRTAYAYGVEERPSLGCGPPPGVSDLARTVRLSWWVSGIAAGVATLVAAVAQRRP